MAIKMSDNEKDYITNTIKNHFNQLSFLSRTNSYLDRDFINYFANEWNKSFEKLTSINTRGASQFKSSISRNEYMMTKEYIKQMHTDLPIRLMFSAFKRDEQKKLLNNLEDFPFDSSPSIFYGHSTNRKEIFDFLISCCKYEIQTCMFDYAINYIKKQSCSDFLFDENNLDLNNDINNCKTIYQNLKNEQFIFNKRQKKLLKELSDLNLWTNIEYTELLSFACNIDSIKTLNDNHISKVLNLIPVNNNLRKELERIESINIDQYFKNEDYGFIDSKSNKIDDQLNKIENSLLNEDSAQEEQQITTTETERKQEKHSRNATEISKILDEITNVDKNTEIKPFDPLNNNVDQEIIELLNGNDKIQHKVDNIIQPDLNDNIIYLEKKLEHINDDTKSDDLKEVDSFYYENLVNEILNETDSAKKDINNNGNTQKKNRDTDTEQQNPVFEKFKNTEKSDEISKKTDDLLAKNDVKKLEETTNNVNATKEEKEANIDDEFENLINNKPKDKSVKVETPSNKDVKSEKKKDEKKKDENLDEFNKYLNYER